MKSQPNSDGFPHYDRRYMCEKGCCGPVHSLTAANRVGVLLAVLLAFSILGSFGRGDFNFFSLGFQFFEVICVILLFLGIDRLNPRLLLPLLVIIAIGLVTTAISILFLFFAAVAVESVAADYVKAHIQVRDLDRQGIEDIRTFVRLVCIFAGILLIAVWLFNYWLYNIVGRCYTYLKDYEYHRLRTGSVALDGQQVAYPIQAAKYQEAPPAYS